MKSVFCIATTRDQAEMIVDRLTNAGFSTNDITLLFPDKESTHSFAHERNTKAPECAITGAGTGGVIGGSLGWLMGIGALLVPGAGPFVAAGPVIATLSIAAVGATIGGITGGLIGLGIPEYEARRYETQLADGNILISVHALTEERVCTARDIFEAAEADDIAIAREVLPKEFSWRERHGAVAHNHQ